MAKKTRYEIRLFEGWDLKEHAEECHGRCDSLVCGIEAFVFTGVFYLMLTGSIMRLYALEPTIIKHSLGRNTRRINFVYSCLEWLDQYVYRLIRSARLTEI